MNLNPTRCRGHILSVILRSPAFYKTHTDCTHLCELVDGLKAMVNRLAEELGELAVVEDLEGAAGRDLTDGGGVEVVMVVALTRLDKDAAI